ncbi:succinate dehydrogenase assembly factor 2 family protein [Photobacterium sp. NCIMB 13483]|uniref:FAD assembly factor SdhE n=1 Tax=Photobacterium piscicola TaxID=1378299 RepID=A0A1T5I2D3_9GAMM|nr:MULTISPECIES: succinate dehydrogenase assembly factor 2 [Photobacterium]MEC6824433.1 succinate dehydrogenase assembly factor 2 [Photobacterium piscicola]MEC6900078.1 succinate dehydrogenase assembly factor 2 [Photobacterium piscicola]PST86685.1 succinate dehydrogenase assembly factor 2 family protein [Photobacterium sp. NCIMB 13483]SKC33254.1 Antitoxin CptB [Photobacterium piscicola]
MLGAEEKARVKWACRRGMLELDVLVMPFFEECFDDLSEQEQRDFISLLTCDDPDLFKWMMQHGRSDNAAHAMMVDKIVAHNNSKLR